MNPLDIVLAGLFEMLGYTNNTPPDAPKLDGSERFDAKGQTSTTSKSGKTRNFQNPNVSGNRPPTLDPLTQRSNLQATPPNRPPGGFGQSPGQMNLDPLRQMQIPQDQMKAPSVPKPKAGKPKPQAPSYGPTSLPNQLTNRLWLQGRKSGLIGPVGGASLGSGAKITPGKAFGIQLGLIGLNRLLANMPGIDAEVKQRLNDALFNPQDPYAELFPSEQAAQPEAAVEEPQTPIQEPIKPSPWSPENNFGTANPADTYKAPKNPSEAPIRSNRTRISPYNNLGAESVSPNRGDLRPNIFAR